MLMRRRSRESVVREDVRGIHTHTEPAFDVLLLLVQAAAANGTQNSAASKSDEAVGGERAASHTCLCTRM
jgi:hypothetical protein